MSLRINIPPLTRVLLILLVGFSSLYLISLRGSGPRSFVAHPELPYIVLVPNISIFYPWVYLTSVFAEKNVITLLIAGATVLYGGKYLERAWGSREFGKFLLVVILIPNLVAAWLCIALYAIVRAESLGWTHIHGSISIQAAFLVAFKQLVPEHTVTILKGLVKIRVKHFPAIFLVANTVSGFLFGTDTASVLCWLGFITSWTYLRFFKTQSDLSGSSTGGKTMKGDASETFAFAYFWPDVVHPPIAAVADVIYSTLLALRICTPFSEEEVETSNEQASARGEGGLPSLLNQAERQGGSGKREEAERRRALALKALDQRLQAASATRQQPVSFAPENVSNATTEDPTSDTAAESRDASNQV